MPNIHDLKQSKFLTKNDIGTGVLVTIGSYAQVNAAAAGADPEMKYALSFHELDKPLVLNSTNGQLIAAIAGSEEFDDWIGRKIVLYFDPNVSFGGKLTGGIRVRAPKPQAVAPAPAPAPVGNVVYTGVPAPAAAPAQYQAAPAIPPVDPDDLPF
jgi:hypothetical protein